MPKQREEAISPITNKIGQFLSSSVVRNIFGQPRTKLNLRKAMDEGKIILINLSKGKIGEDNAAMIGSLLVTKFQIDAMSRADIDYNDRRDFYLYIDEFQNFATSSFTTILSEARKYKLSLIVANQFTSQLLPEIKDAIFGNIGTIISFTLGHDDATIMSAQFKEMVSSNDLISLPKFTAYSKLMIDGVTSDPFSMKTMPLSRPE
ncbi:TraM recognition domain-containing protein [Patescibacteria group bacterium]|nr:TraM recognition domain-containing protein [Patescibacteria group bacterium]MBP7841989.1 TraM recognition domain-containing protein [Patescibacteria group bacterium]